MGDEDRLDPAGIVGKPVHVGHDEVDAGRGLHVAEGHAEVDDDQPLRALRPIAVDIGVHADFAGTAERQVDQAVLCHAVSRSRL